MSRTLRESTLVFEITLPYRDLEFLVNQNGFLAFFDVGWSDFLSEVGNQSATLRVRPVEAIAPVQGGTLDTLVEEQEITQPEGSVLRAGS